MFNAFVRSLTRALRTLLEVTSLNMLLRHDARRARDDLLDIALSLPFQTDVNTGFGVLAKVYLDALTHINGGARVRDAAAPGVAMKKEMALDLCEETFPGVKAPRAEVERGFRFWDIVRGAFFFVRRSGAGQLGGASARAPAFYARVRGGRRWLIWVLFFVGARCDEAAALGARGAWGAD